MRRKFYFKQKNLLHTRHTLMVRGISLAELLLLINALGACLHFFLGILLLDTFGACVVKPGVNRGVLAMLTVLSGYQKSSLHLASTALSALCLSQSCLVSSGTCVPTTRVLRTFLLTLHMAFVGGRRARSDAAELRLPPPDEKIQRKGVARVAASSSPLSRALARKRAGKKAPTQTSAR